MCLEIIGNILLFNLQKKKQYLKYLLFIYLNTHKYANNSTSIFHTPYNTMQTFISFLCFNEENNVVSE